MTTNHKHYEAIPSHNGESQALIADEAIEQGLSPRRRPFVILFLCIALATIAVGLSMARQTSPSGAVGLGLGSGRYCRANYQVCGDEYCHIDEKFLKYDNSYGHCQRPRPYGQHCWSDEMCASRDCNDGKCTLDF